jgi:hypothetical protein
MTEQPHPDPHDQHDAPEPAEPPRTIRTGLRDRRQKAVDSLFLERQVPRLDPPVFVRFKPLEGHRVDAINKAASKSKDPERSVVGNARALAESCVGIYEKIDGQIVSVDPTDERVVEIPDDPKAPLPAIPDDWPKFDATLAALLGMANPATVTAVQVVRELYLTDGDVTSEAGELTAWSGYAGEEALEEYSGN